MSIISEINLDNNRLIRLVKGDITERKVDTIVNAANSYLRHGGGAAAAIVRNGGVLIQQESDKIGFVQVGFARYNYSG
jgi:O-acetyl-ADP-ribose deacetylase